jgi:hypothetical protein
LQFYCVLVMVLSPIDGAPVQDRAMRLPQPDSRLFDLLPGASFADSYRWRNSACPLEASEWLDRMLKNPPQWVDHLMALRNRIGAWFGLKTASVDGFPVMHKSTDIIVVGMDDWHLDFRIACLCDQEANGTQLVTIGTVVRPHNLAGHAYLAVVMPFHRLISKRQMARAAKPHPN